MKAGLSRIMSFYPNVVLVGSLRINLRWEGHHENTDL
jgi:hypothetical protein